jgi:hypothetical protein
MLLEEFEKQGKITAAEIIAKRQFQNITMSHSWVTAAVPVSAFLMIVSSGVRLFRQITNFPSAVHGGGRARIPGEASHR